MAAKATTTPQRSNKDEVEAYIDGVLRGKITAGKLLKAACQRHRDDLKNAKRKGIYFDEAEANRAIDFARLLKHSSGEYAGRPFELVDFQKFITWVLFGWRRASDGMRRFRRAFISLASGNGKSPFAAFVLMLCVFFDSPVEPRAAGYVVSTKKSQARPVFEEIKAFCAQDPNLRKMLVTLKDNINCPTTQSKIEILGSEGTVDDGLVPHCVVYDEIHRARDRHRGTLEMIQSKLGKRRQPLILTITTAGDDQSAVWSEQYELATKVVARGNSIEADDLFVFIAELDDDEELFREAAWPKANPMLPHGVVKLDQLRADVALAKIDPREKKRVMRLRMNRLVTSAVKAITSEMWATGNLPLPDLSGLTGFGGLDLGWKDDLAALCYAFPLDPVEINGVAKRRIALLCDAFIPEGCARNLAEEPWASWIRDGYLTVTHGQVTDPDAIYESIERRGQEFAIGSIAMDPNNARAPGIHIETTLGIKAFWHGQGFTKMNEPTRELIDATREGRIVHGGNPVLAWAMLNLVLQTDPRGYVRPAKNKAKDKIDPAVAAVMSINELMFQEETPPPTGRVFAI
jgi:phage terminase large subunit-like protein